MAAGPRRGGEASRRRRGRDGGSSAGEGNARRLRYKAFFVTQTPGRPRGDAADEYERFLEAIAPAVLALCDCRAVLGRGLHDDAGAPTPLSDVARPALALEPAARPAAAAARDGLRAAHGPRVSSPRGPRYRVSSSRSDVEDAEADAPANAPSVGGGRTLLGRARSPRAVSPLPPAAPAPAPDARPTF